MAVVSGTFKPATGAGAHSIGAGVSYGGGAKTPAYQSTRGGGMLSNQAAVGQAAPVQAGNPHMVTGTANMPYQAQVGYTPQAPAPVENPALLNKPYMPPVAPPLPNTPGKRPFDTNGQGPVGISPIELIKQGVDPETAIAICGPSPEMDIVNPGFRPLPVSTPDVSYTDYLSNPPDFLSVGQSLNSMWNPTAFNGLGQGSGSGQAQMQGMLSQLLMALRNNAGF